MILHNAIEASRVFLTPALAQAGCVVDATAGNGHDVLFFCQHTKPDCRIWAFDIQPAAIQSCERLLEQHGFCGRVRLIQADHAHLAEYVDAPVNAAIFNLGYLPGQNHVVTTTPSSLAPALEGLLGLLAPGGRIGIVAYPGHESGRQEIAFLESFFPGCSQRLYTITRLSFINQINHPAILYSISKARRD